MKYIITEEQNERLEKTIMEFFDKNLTPFGGWESPKSYSRDVEDVGEIFFFLVESNGNGEDEHMWYSACDAPLVTNGCPVVTLPKSTYDALNGYFGDKWKRLFRRWFIIHTGLLVVQIDTL